MGFPPYAFGMIYPFAGRELFVGELDDLDTFFIILTDDASNSQNEFQLQRSLEFDEQDTEAGMDTYCLIFPDGGVYYGGVTSCILRREQLEFSFDEEVMALSGITRLQIALNADPLKFDLLRDGLTRMFKGDRCEPTVLSLG